MRTSQGSATTAISSHALSLSAGLKVDGVEEEDEPPSCTSNSNVSGLRGRQRVVSDVESLGESALDAAAHRNQTIAAQSCLQRLQTLFIPTRPIGPSPGYLASLKAAAFYSPLNIFLLLIPVSWALHYTKQPDTLVFVFSALAIVPLAALLGLGTEQIALRTSQSVGGLLNATLGNVVEMIIAGIALHKVSQQ